MTNAGEGPAPSRPPAPARLCPWGRQSPAGGRGPQLTGQVGSSQTLHRQVGQEAVHPVEEEALAAAQELLPLRLAVRGRDPSGAAGRGQADARHRCGQASAPGPGPRGWQDTC